MKKISVVVPCYNEEEALPIFYDTFLKETADMPVEWEFVFVDDGSKDGTLEGFRALHAKDERVHYISFSRNFGKESAMFAGLEAATGDYIAIMDVDLQDPPALLPDMLRGLEEEGYDCVATRRVTRKGEPPIRSWFARKFYQLMGKISRTEIVDGARDFRLMTRQMVDAILSMKEYSRFSKGIFSWVGFSTKWLEYENIERSAGETKWNFWKLLDYAIEGIIGYSTAPLRFATITGGVTAVAAFVYLLAVVLEKLIWGIDVPGYATIIVLILLLGGIQLLCIGIIGEYVGRTFEQTKDRPIYIAKEILLPNNENETA